MRLEAADTRKKTADLISIITNNESNGLKWRRSLSAMKPTHAA
jgi:hypothetical protein